MITIHWNIIIFIIIFRHIYFRYYIVTVRVRKSIRRKEVWILNKIIKGYHNVIEISYQLIPKIESTERLKKAIDRYRILDNEPKINFSKIDSKVSDLVKKKRQLEKKINQEFNLEKKIESYKNLSNRSDELSEEIKELEKSISVLKKKLKVCPTCNKEWWCLKLFWLNFVMMKEQI